MKERNFFNIIEAVKKSAQGLEITAVRWPDYRLVCEETSSGPKFIYWADAADYYRVLEAISEGKNLRLDVIHLEYEDYLSQDYYVFDNDEGKPKLKLVK